MSAADFQPTGDAGVPLALTVATPWLSPVTADADLAPNACSVDPSTTVGPTPATTGKPCGVSHDVVTSPRAITGLCPGALRPMQSGDGLIVRLKLTGGIVDVSLAERIARWSNQWGNGQIDLSSRANLQLRGLSTRHLPDLYDALADAGLLDGSEAGEAVRNVISSPLAGIDPNAALDIRPVAKSLEQRLAADESLHALPAKFGFAIDDGGSLGLDGVPADIRFVASHDATFMIRLAGAAHHMGPCHPDGVAEIAAVLARVFLHLRAPAIRRMRDLIAALGVEAVAREGGLVPAWEPRPTPTPLPSSLLGAHALGAGGFLGVGLPFGRIAANDLAELASSATRMGARDLRLTPWRAILVPLPSVAAARTLSAGLDTNSFTLDPRDPRRRIAACPGAPSCGRATTPVREDAAALATGLAETPGYDIMIHVSGCEKGCAHPHAAPVTLVGRDGCYDVVRNGTAAGSPAMRDLTLAQAADQIPGSAA